MAGSAESAADVVALARDVGNDLRVAPETSRRGVKRPQNLTRLQRSTLGGSVPGPDSPG